MDQRYYHFVALRETRPIELSDYWRMLGEALPCSALPGRHQMEHRKFRLHGEFGRRVSSAQVQDGGPEVPLVYDLLACRATLPQWNCLLLGFPYSSLGEQLVDQLLERAGLLEYGRFLRTDVPKLISEMEGVRSDEYYGLETKIVGVQVVVKNDTSLTAIRLGGQNPLGAEIYNSFLKDRIGDGSFEPNRCVLASRREADENDTIFVEGRRRTIQSRTHVDTHGNFRVYAQIGGGNLTMLPLILERLQKLECLRDGKMNPLKHRQEE